MELDLILEHFDLKKMGHNSDEYIHTIIEALKIAFADREKFYSDPKFVTVPISGLLSKEYAQKCAGRIKDTSCPMMPDFGDPWQFNHIPMPEEIKLGPKGETLILNSGKNQTVQIVTVDFFQQINTADAPFKGPANAPVVIAVFDDFQ